MRKLVVVFLAVTLLTMNLGVPVHADDPPPIPHAFYGSVTINGNKAPVGTEIEARGENVITDIEGNPITTTKIGEYGSPHPMERKLVVQGHITEGTILTFYVDGFAADQTHAWHSGEETELDLTVDLAVVMFSLIISSTVGGEVTAPGEGTFSYDEDEVVDLVATADTGYRFVNWTGDVDTIADVDAAATTITMDGDYDITANFEPVRPFPWWWIVIGAVIAGVVVFVLLRRPRKTA